MGTTVHGRVAAQRRRRAAPAQLFEGYRPSPSSYDEVFDPAGQPRTGLGPVISLLEQMGRLEFRTRKRLADLVFRELGVTFSVYADGRGIERIFPFDPIPRVIAAKDWDRVARGLAQRIQALNAFLADVYGEQRILAEGRVPADLVHRSQGYLPAVRGLMPPSGVYVHVAGIDLVRGPDGEFLVLEDNLRTPSGVSYVLENRMVMKRVYPQIFERAGVRSVDEYPVRLREALDSGLGPVPVGHLRLSSPRRGPAAHPGGHPALQPELRRPGLDLCPQRPPGRRPRRGPSPRHPAGVRAGGAHRFRARLLLAADLDP